MNNPTEIIEELTLIKFGLRMNSLTDNLLVQFVDHLIIKEDNPDYLYIEISTSSKNEIIEILESFTAINKEIIDENKLLGIVHSVFQNNLLNLENTIMILYNMNNEFDFEGNINNEIRRLDDQYHLVSNRYVSQTINELEMELNLFFSVQKNPLYNLQILKE